MFGETAPPGPVPRLVSGYCQEDQDHGRVATSGGEVDLGVNEAAWLAVNALVHGEVNDGPPN